jgi:hypothetical protein
VLRKTIGKRMAARLEKIRQQLRQRLHERVPDTTEWLQSVVRASFRYHAVPRNEERLKAFRHEVLRMWWWQLRRRGQRTRWTWNKFWEQLGCLIPEVETLYPYPDVRLCVATHPRSEPCALGALARLCARGAGRPASLPRPHKIIHNLGRAFWRVSALYGGSDTRPFALSERLSIP